MKEFIKLDKYGQLYIDKILFESYFPIIFTCINDNQDIFISVCCQNNEKGCKWLLGKTDGTSMANMLRDKMTIRQLLLEHSEGKISVDYTKKDGYTVAYDNSDWAADSLYLPKEDSYMYADDEEFEDEIAYFLSLNEKVSYNKKYSECAAGTLEMVSGESEPMAETEAVLVSTIGISIPSEIVNTLRVSGKLRVDFASNAESYTKHERYKSVYHKSIEVELEDLSIKVEPENHDYYADAA